MYEYVQVTLRSKEGKWKDIDIRVHAKQPWEHIMEILTENGVVIDTNHLCYQSLRQGKSFSGNLCSIEAGIYTGDIIEIGGC